MNTLYLYLWDDDEELEKQVRALSPRIEIISRKQLEDNEDLISKIEVAYGFPMQKLEAATSLKWLQNMGAGVNRLITPKIAESDLIITNVSGIHAKPITEHMFGMLLGITRNLNQALEAQKTQEWKRDLGHSVESLFGKTLGILGMGAIGEQAARVGKAFEMRTIGLRRSGGSHPDVEEMFTPETKLDFFKQCDVVMNLLPQTEKTEKFMGEAEFEALPDGAIVVNAGRGGTIDTDALIKALNKGKIKAALLDVTDPEPLPSGHPLWTTPGVVITPHYSGAHPEYGAEANEIFLDNLKLYLAGKELHHVVDKSEGY